MQVIDVSHRTSKLVLCHRVHPRRGIVIHESNGHHSLGYLLGEGQTSEKPRSADILLGRSGEVYLISRPGRYVRHTGTARHRLYQESDFSIDQGYVGVELENHTAAGEVPTTAQYISLAFVCVGLVLQHGMSILNIVPHYEVALPHGRRKDPEVLNWATFTAEMLAPYVDATSHEYRGMLP